MCGERTGLCSKLLQVFPYDVLWVVWVDSFRHHSPKASQDRNYRVPLLEPSLQVRLVHVILYLTLLPHIFLETDQVRDTPSAQALACSRLLNSSLIEPESGCLRPLENHVCLVCLGCAPTVPKVPFPLDGFAFTWWWGDGGSSLPSGQPAGPPRWFPFSGCRCTDSSLLILCLVVLHYTCPLALSRG